MFVEKHVVLAGIKSNLHESVFVEHTGTTQECMMAEHDRPIFLPQRSCKLPTWRTTLQKECECKSAPICSPRRRFGTKLCEYVPLYKGKVDLIFLSRLRNHRIPKAHFGESWFKPCRIRPQGMKEAAPALKVRFPCSCSFFFLFFFSFDASWSSTSRGCFSAHFVQYSCALYNQALILTPMNRAVV